MKTVLLVDDEVENLKCLSEILSRFGYQVIAKSDAMSALSVVGSGEHVDLIISDYRMPAMDGLDFVLQVRRIMPLVPVIMLTGYGAVETYLKSLSLGVYEYVNKPVKVKELGRIISAALDSVPARSADRNAF